MDLGLGGGPPVNLRGVVVEVEVEDADDHKCQDGSHLEKGVQTKIRKLQLI